MAEEKKKKQRKPTAVKRNLQSEKRNQKNKEFKSSAKTAIKDYKKAIEDKEAKEVISKKLNLVNSLMDKAVKKKIYKKNKVNRVKSQLSSIA